MDLFYERTNLAVWYVSPTACRHQVLAVSASSSTAAPYILADALALPLSPQHLGNLRDAGGSPLGKSLLRLPKVTSVFFGTDFITVNKEEEADWDALRTLVLHTIMEKYDADEPVYTEAVLAEDTAPSADDSEIVAAIKEVIDLRIRPAVQDDGGDVFFQYVRHGM